MALIPDDPKQRNALLVGLLAAAGFYLFWSYWYSPRKTEVDEMQARYEQLESNNSRAQIIAARGGTDLQERLALYERHVAQLERLIPESEEVPALLADIYTVARQSGVNDAALRPEPEQVGAFYTRRSYELEVVGQYHDIGAFLTRIASLARIITPVDLELTRFQGQRELLDMQEPLTARLRIQTYILPGATPSPTPAAGEPAGEGEEG
jgi:type IV pilus assembly protein PilO